MGSGKATAAAFHPTVETWKDSDTDLRVTQPDGYLCKVSLRAKVDLSPDRIFDILTEEDNTRVFSNIKSIPFRKVLEDDHMGRQVIEVEHIGEWHFLMFRGSLHTKMVVRQNRRNHTVEFKLKEAGFMKDFEGKWSMEPFTQDTLDHIYGPARPSAPWFSPARALRSLQQMVPGRRQACMITLEQSVQPAIHIPPPLDRLLRGITASQVKSMLQDLRAEVKRVKKAEESRSGGHVVGLLQKSGHDTHDGRRASAAPAVLSLTWL